MFAKHLREEADKFRREVLKSDDERDVTVMDPDWTKNQKKEGSAEGGPYLALHLRRGDFLYAHPDKVPSLDNTVKQIKELLKKHKLETVFLATDSTKEGDSGRSLFLFIIILCICQSVCAVCVTVKYCDHQMYL